MAVYDRQIYTLGFMPAELILQPPLRVAAKREQHEPRRIAIDPVNDERPAFAMRSEISDEKFLDGRGLAPAVERHGQQTRRLVDHDQFAIFVDDLQIFRAAAQQSIPASENSAM